jgi:hypothetical protein
VQLFALTGVPPDRQKITAGAKQIKDGTDLKTIGLKDQQVRIASMRALLRSVSPGSMLLDAQICLNRGCVCRC